MRFLCEFPFSSRIIPQKSQHFPPELSEVLNLKISTSFEFQKLKGNVSTTTSEHVEKSEILQSTLTKLLHLDQ